MNAVAMIDIPEQPVIGNVEAEAALLGGMMLANTVIDQVADQITAEDFSEPLMGRIFSAIVREHSRGLPANSVTLRPYFTDDEAMTALGGPGFLAKLTGSNASIIGVSGFVEQVSELARRRNLIASLQDVIVKAHEWEQPVNDLVSEVETALSDATRLSEGTHEPHAAEAATEALKAIETNDPGMQCGIEAVDLAMGAIRPKNLAIVAGRPGMGKTSLALSYALGAARKGTGVLFISLEMSAEELGQRLLSDMTFDEEHRYGVPYDAIVNGRVDRNQMRALVGARDQLADLPLQIVDTGALKLSRLATIVRRWRRRFTAKGQELGLVVIDYLQLLHPNQRTSGRYETITEISMGLKELAKTQGIGVMALAQLSRKVEDRPDRRPMLSDLRDSGQIEQDADIILFLLREEYYVRKNEPHPNSPEYPEWYGGLVKVENRIDFICAKRRKGAERTTQGRFYGAYQAVRG